MSVKGSSLSNKGVGQLNLVEMPVIHFASPGIVILRNEQKTHFQTSGLGSNRREARWASESLFLSSGVRESHINLERCRVLG
jgi:hypothetical protein